MDKWTKDASGNVVMPEAQSDFLDWLLSDVKDPKTEQEWAVYNDVSHETIRKWKRDRRFREQWEKRSAERNVSPERLQTVIDVLYQSAVATADVGAAKQYLLYTEKFLPPKEVRRDNVLAQMTDDELLAEIEALVLRVTQG